MGPARDGGAFSRGPVRPSHHYNKTFQYSTQYMKLRKSLIVCYNSSAPQRGGARSLTTRATLSNRVI